MVKLHDTYSEGTFGTAVWFYAQVTFLYYFMVFLGVVGFDNPWFGCNDRGDAGCRTWALAAQILYTPSSLVMVFMFGLLVPKQLTRAEVLKKAVLTHWESINVLERLVNASLNTNLTSQGGEARSHLSAYGLAVKQSMEQATLIARRDSLRHVVWERLRGFRLWVKGKSRVDVVAEYDDRNKEVKKQADYLAFHYSRAYQAAYGTPPAAHGVPMNGDTALGTVLTLTAVGNSTFTTRLLLIFFSAVSAICGFSQNLHDDGSIDMETATVHIFANYIMIILPYAILSAFVFRTDIFKERGTVVSDNNGNCPEQQAFKLI